MKKPVFFYIKWLIPAMFVALGIFLTNFIHGHSFLGLICFCIAGIIAAYYLIALLRENQRMACKVLSTCLTSVLCLGLTVCGLTEAVILRASLGDPGESCRYMVVLGAKVNGTEPSLSLTDRINAAADYLKANPDVIAVLSGGQGADEGITEARCMFNKLTDMGIDPDRLWLEEKATSTWENIKFSLDVIEEKTGSRPASIGLLSSEYHLFRASLFAKECGVDTVGIPAKTAWLSLRINYFTREVAGVWHYLILGGNYQ